MGPESREQVDIEELDSNAGEISTALGREHAHTVLHSADRPIGAGELSDDQDIPIATCYRRLEELADVGLLEQVETDTEDGREESKYRRVVDEISISYDDEEVTVTLDRSAGLSGTLDSLWRRF